MQCYYCNKYSLIAEVNDKLLLSFTIILLFVCYNMGRTTVRFCCADFYRAFIDTARGMRSFLTSHQNKSNNRAYTLRTPIDVDDGLFVGFK